MQGMPAAGLGLPPTSLLRTPETWDVVTRTPWAAGSHWEPWITVSREAALY